MASLTHVSKVQGTSRSTEDLKTVLHIGLGKEKTEKIEKPKFFYPGVEKIYEYLPALIYNWKMADRIEAVFSLKNRSKLK